MKNYDISAILIFIDFINDQPIDINSLTYFAITDLIELTKVFEVFTLLEIIEKANF